MTFFYDLNKKLDSIREKPEVTHQQLNERDMSRAAKGYEKYGKEGMEALAKAGREGKALDPIRKKYDKYDESVEEGSTGNYSAKKARAGKDIGKPGKNFEKIAKSAGERYGSKERGEKVAGAVLAKLRAKHEDVEEGVVDTLKKAGRKVLDTVAPDDEALLKDLQKKVGVPQTGKKPGGDFADKIAGAKKEVDEMLGDVAAEAIKSALTPKQKKLDKNNNGKLDANDFEMLRKGAKQETDEGWEDMLKDVERRRSARVGDVERGHKHDIEHTATGRKVTRRVDDQGMSVGADDDTPADGEKRGRGRPKGSKKAMGAKGPSGRSKLMTREEIEEAIAALEENGYSVSPLEEKAVSKAQQRFMGMVHAAQKGEKPASKEVAKVAKSMKKSDAEDFAKTKHKGLPEKKKEESADKDKPKKVKEQGGTDTPTASSGFSFGKGIYDSMNHELETMIAESMNISMNMSNDSAGGPSKSLTVTATDDDAMKLSDLLKNAGLGAEGGADLDHPGAIEVHGAEDLADKIRQAVGGHEDGEVCPACGSADCGCEGKMDEAYGDNVVDQNSPDYPTNTETSDDALQYAGGLNKPKSTGQTVGAPFNRQDQRQGPMREDTELARIKEMAGIKEAAKPDFLDVDKDGDKEESFKKAVDDKEEKKVDESILTATANLWKEYKIQAGV